MVRMRLLPLVLVAILGACASPPYFEFDSEISQAAAMKTGDAVFVMVWALAARPGDEVELHGLELVDAHVDGATITQLAVDMSEVEGDGIGIVSAARPGTASAAVDALEPLEGFLFRSPNAVGNGHLVLKVAALRAGVVDIGSVRITFSVNGGPSQVQDIPSTVRLCVDDPKPTSCEPPTLPDD